MFNVPYDDILSLLKKEEITNLKLLKNKNLPDIIQISKKQDKIINKEQEIKKKPKVRQFKRVIK